MVWVLLLVAPRILVYGREKSYNFLHLTVQEFCAAWHLSNKYASEEEIKVYRDCDYLQMTMMFYCGITGLRNRAILDIVLPYKQLDSKITRKEAHNVLKFLYEAHNSEACQIIGDHLGGNICLNHYDTITDTLSDMIHLINYFITEYKGKLVLIDMSPPNFVKPDDLALLAKSLVKRKELKYNTDGVVLIVSFVASPENTSLFYPSLLLAVGNYPITELYIDGIIQVGELSLQFLLQLCLSDTLTVLDINRINVSCEETLSLSDCGNISLCDLRITRCNLNPVVDEIGKFMSHCKSLISLNLNCNKLDDHGVEMLVQHLTGISTLQHLDLSNNNITAVGIDHLRGLMTNNPMTLTSMELSCNPLKDEGVCLLLQILKTPMEHIGLSWVEMTSLSYQSVANILDAIKSINFTVPDEPEMISLEIANTKLLESVGLNGLNDSTHYQIINALKQNDSIKSLTLSYNNCNADKCVKDLCQFVKDNKSVVELGIHCSTASPQILLSVADSLATNNFLNYLSFNLFYEVGTHDHKDIKETVLEFLKRVPPVSALEELILVIEGDYLNSDFFDPCYDFEYKIKIDYKYHQNIEQCVKKINRIRSVQNKVNPLRVTIRLV